MIDLGVFITYFVLKIFSSENFLFFYHIFCEFLAQLFLNFFEKILNFEPMDSWIAHFNLSVLINFNTFYVMCQYF